MNKETDVSKSPETSPEKTGSEKRLAERIAAGHERNANRGTVRSMVEDHPIAVIAGGIVLGAVIARLLPKSGLSRLGGRAVALAAAGAELAALYGSRAADSAGDMARDGRERLGEIGETIGESAGEARRKTIDLADVALAGARAVGGKAARRASEIVSRVRH